MTDGWISTARTGLCLPSRCPCLTAYYMAAKALLQCLLEGIIIATKVLERMLRTRLDRIRLVTCLSRSTDSGKPLSVAWNSSQLNRWNLTPCLSTPTEPLEMSYAEPSIE